MADTLTGDQIDMLWEIGRITDSQRDRLREMIQPKAPSPKEERSTQSAIGYGAAKPGATVEDLELEFNPRPKSPAINYGAEKSGGIAEYVGAQNELERGLYSLAKDESARKGAVVEPKMVDVTDDSPPRQLEPVAVRFTPSEGPYGVAQPTQLTPARHFAPVTEGGVRGASAAKDVANSLMNGVSKEGTKNAEEVQAALRAAKDEEKKRQLIQARKDKEEEERAMKLTNAALSLARSQPYIADGPALNTSDVDAWIERIKKGRAKYG